MRIHLIVTCMGYDRSKGGRSALKKIVVAAAAAVIVLLAGLMLLFPRPAEESAQSGAAARGMMLLDEVQGVYVLAVTDRSPADLAGVEPGDILISAAGIPIDRAQRLDEMMEASQETMQLQLCRDGLMLQVNLPAR